jgi:hypothetical protein
MKSGTNLIIDAVALVLYLLAANPAVTGLLLHEYLSLALLVVIAAHCAVHYDWVLAVLKKHVAGGDTANLVLDAVSLLAFLLVTVSGLMVSRFILPLFGYVAGGYFIWKPLHSISAKVLLALMLVHVIVHWRWFVSMFSKRRRKGADEREKHGE